MCVMCVISFRSCNVNHLISICLLAFLCALVRLKALVCVSECIYLLMPEFNKARLFIKNLRKCGISMNSGEIDPVGLGSGSEKKYLNGCRTLLLLCRTRVGLGQKKSADPH